MYAQCSRHVTNVFTEFVWMRALRMNVQIGKQCVFELCSLWKHSVQYKQTADAAWMTFLMEVYNVHIDTLYGALIHSNGRKWRLRLDVNRFFFSNWHTPFGCVVCASRVCVSAMEWRGEERRVVSLLRYDSDQYSPPIVDVSRKSMWSIIGYRTKHTKPPWSVPISVT